MCEKESEKEAAAAAAGAGPRHLRPHLSQSSPNGRTDGELKSNLAMILVDKMMPTPALN